jgi:hypothetical protein
MKHLTLMLWLLLSLATTGVAQKADPGDFKKTIDLEPAFISKRFFAQGRAVIAQQHGVQYFGVSMITNVDDGTEFDVMVTTPQGTLWAGTFTVVLGEGQLVQKSSRDISPAFPVTTVEAVFIRDHEGLMWLKGSF